MITIWLLPLPILTSNDPSVDTLTTTIVTPVVLILPWTMLVETAAGKVKITMILQQLQIDWVALAKIVFTTKEILLLDGVGGMSKIKIKIILLKLY